MSEWGWKDGIKVEQLSGQKVKQIKCFLAGKSTWQKIHYFVISLDH